MSLSFTLAIPGMIFQRAVALGIVFSGGVVPRAFVPVDLTPNASVHIMGHLETDQTVAGVIFTTGAGTQSDTLVGSQDFDITLTAGDTRSTLAIIGQTGFVGTITNLDVEVTPAP